MSGQTELFPADQVLPLWWLVPNAQDAARVEPVELDEPPSRTEVTR